MNHECFSIYLYIITKNANLVKIMEENKKTKKAGKVKVETKKKELTISQLKQKGVNMLPEDYLSEAEQKIFTRINGKDVRSWNMTVNDFLKLHEGKEIFILPNDKKTHWEFNGKSYIRGYAT